MSYLENLKTRGLLQDISDQQGLARLPLGTPFYHGIDPSAPSLQLGNLVGLIVSVHLAHAGFKPILLFGGATGSIGDPSGRSSERQLMDMATIERNLETQKQQVTEIMERCEVQVQFVNNLDWTKAVSLLEFLREIGKHFTVNYMIAKDHVRSRLSDTGISFTEFSYMLLQSFDFLYLYQHQGCRLQIGGSDQWGNITAGLELIRRKVQGEAFAFSYPLILDSQGRKFGKSEAGAIWLDPKLSSPYRLHQYLLNVEDDQVMYYLQVFTFVTPEELREIRSDFESRPDKRRAQKALADAVCTFVHGAAATSDAQKCAEVLFGGSMRGIPDEKLEDIFSGAPSSVFSRAKISNSSALDLLMECGAIKSRGEGKKLITAGGAYLNNERITDAATALAGALTDSSRILVIRTGKKNYHLVRVED